MTEIEIKRHLPVAFQDKKHISYSEVSTWMECPWRHKLKYLEKIDLDKPTVHTQFGQIIHDMLEEYLKTRIMPSAEITRENLEYSFKENGIQVESEKDWHDTIEDFANEFPIFLEETFNDWKFIGAEDKLYEAIEGYENLSFKGFMDGIIEVPKKSRLKSITNDETEYWILDHKTTSWGWSLDKKTDPQKIMQLALYKHFWSKKLNIPLKEIRCAFILLKRTAKKGKKIELVTASIGDKTIANALSTIDKMMFSIKKDLTPKNRNSCTWCPYAHTEFCT